VVHGGGKEIDAALALAGIPKRQVDGLRVTDAPTLDAVVAVLAGSINTRLVAAVREELEGEIDPPYRVRETSTGRHIAITVEPHVQNAWEVLAVYQRLGQLSGLEYVF
jgi:putative lipoic acid-binding regulatory protein